MADWNEISEMLQKGKAKEVADLCQKAIDQGNTAKEILNEGLMLGMGIVGERFKKNEVYVPEVLIAARAMNAGIAILKPHMVGGVADTRGKVVLGTVKGDLHDIGKNLVKIMMEGKGLEVIDLGADVSTEKFVATAQEQGANIIACSALLTTTMTEMENVVKAVTEAGLRDSITIMVGGAPVTQNFCESIGADIYSADATSAAEAALEACAG